MDQKLLKNRKTKKTAPAPSSSPSPSPAPAPAPSWSAYQIIAKKRDGGVLCEEEIKWFIEGLLEKKVAPYQASALLMAIYLRGFSTQETVALTLAMLESGERLEEFGPCAVDKHSTGGVGDKASFILAPVAAACGVQVPMIAGRGLGHTGGTIDKIESINGFRTELTLKEFSHLVSQNGMALSGQTREIAPADGLLYSLRDVTATVNSIPLITASIMSKKLAEGVSSLVMDVKVGSGAFMGELGEAQKLAQSLRQVAGQFSKNMITMITDMSQPLGWAVGNSLEVMESLAVLKGQGPADLRQLSLELASGMIFLAGQAPTLAAALERATRALDSGQALEQFRQLVGAQGGDVRYLEDDSLFQVAPEKTVVAAPADTYLHRVDNEALGQAVVALGGGRRQMGDQIDHGVGLIFHKKVGDFISAQEPIFTLYHHPHQQAQADQLRQQLLLKHLFFGEMPLAASARPPLIYQRDICARHSKEVSK